MTKRTHVMHWADYQGVLRIACGRRQVEGGPAVAHTTIRAKVTCQTCLRIMGTKPTRHPPVGSKPLHEAGRRLDAQLGTYYPQPIQNENMVQTAAFMNTMRLQYAGAVGLLCTLSVRLSDHDYAERDDNLDSIEAAVADFCKLTGWTYQRVLHRVEVFPPQPKGANDDGKEESSNEG